MERKVYLMDYEKIGKFIAEKRKEKGMTQKELANQLGIGDKAVSKWECGRGMPDNSIMIPLCSLLGINVNELLMGETLSEKDYNESTEDIVLTLMGENESLKKKNKRNLFSCVLVILLALVLFSLIVMSLQSSESVQLGVLLYFYDPFALVADIILVLVMLLATGNGKAFVQSFLLIFKNDVDRNKLFPSLQAVKLAFASFLLGGGALTLIDTIFMLGTMEKTPEIGVSISLLTMLYGVLFAMLLLPVKYKLESKMEEMNEKSDKS